ncbi:hypothetical protein C0V76_10985 [Uliginosibacterium sp. TH139]|nr:hypothetical protein C0V76_10985 [Uliginosibacterium sp. TH139]
MAIYALLQAHEVYHDESYANAASKAVGWQLSKHYRSHGDMAYIAEGKKVKLGAVALAALALNTPQLREKYPEYLGRLFKFTEYLWEDSGGFHTFWRPADRDGDCQNFYPGEALLFWAVRWLDSRDHALWDKIYRSFEYYRSWHLNNRNPAFVPWHTQAYSLLWRETRDEEMKSFIFEMNDWLVDVQQWETVARYPDAMGRFYDPTRPFGPPHSSSTGVYLEGLIDAYSVAQSLGDDMRMLRYARAIKRGFRNVIQLQLNHSVELSRYPNAGRAFGGVRTTEYDETIRIDNVQHNLIAALKIVSRKSPLSYIFSHDN